MRLDNGQLQRIKQRIRKIILSQKGEFTKYEITNLYFKGIKEPTRKEWSRINWHVQRVVDALCVENKVRYIGEKMGDAPTKKKVYILDKFIKDDKHENRKP